MLTASIASSVAQPVKSMAGFNRRAVAASERHLQRLGMGADAEDLRRMPVDLPGQSEHALELAAGAERAAELGFPDIGPGEAPPAVLNADGEPVPQVH